MPIAASSTTNCSPGAMHNFISYSLSNIIRQPGSLIQFAAFDPATATGDTSNASAFRKLTLNEELCRPKRIVVETAPNGHSTWRFVPNARREPGVVDEGIWPRVVDVCGHLRTLTQDEWDLYKLDRDFECLIRLSPNYTTVNRLATAPPPVPPEAQAMPEPSPAEKFTVKEEPVDDLPFESQILAYKRCLSEGATSRRLSGSNSKGQRKKAKARCRFTDEFPSSSEDEISHGLNDESEEDEVSVMVVDEEPAPSRPRVSERLQKVRANKEEARKRRREANARRREKQGLGIIDEDDNDDHMSWTEIPTAGPSSTPIRPQATPSPFPKRKVECFSEDEEAANESSEDDYPRFKTYEWSGTTKRTRTISPLVARRAAKAKKAMQEARRKFELDQRVRARAEAMHEHLMKEIYEEAARYQSMMSATETPTSADPGSFHSGSYSGYSSYEAQSGQETQPGTSSQETLIDEEVLRLAAIEESRRKLAELERDRPTWEEEARKRAAQEAEQRAFAEAAHKTADAANYYHAYQSAAEREKQREEAQRRAAEEERIAKEVAAAEIRRKREHVRQIAIRESRDWLSRGWNVCRALERYIVLCEAFDASNFSKGDVIVFETVPWPVLKRPGTFGVEDIDWTAVESFFRQVKHYMPAMDYKKLVEKSHKRFHPDRWLSRRVLQCVEDEEEKECLEMAANTVAQAITPVWQAVTGR